jgi:hypothetical protein
MGSGSHTARAGQGSGKYAGRSAANVFRDVACEVTSMVGRQVKARMPRQWFSGHRNQM